MKNNPGLDIEPDIRIFFDEIFDHGKAKYSSPWSWQVVIDAVKDHLERLRKRQAFIESWLTSFEASSTPPGEPPDPGTAGAAFPEPPVP